MPSQTTPFVGRKEELKAFHHLLTADTGRAIVIVGQQGMGKTTLANELVFQAQAHFNECFCLRYNIIQQDTADAIMERMLEEAFAGAKVEGSFSTSPKRKSQWAALLKVIPKGKDLLGLFQALKQQPGRPVRERLLVALQQVSAKLKAHQRLLFVIDPDEYMQKESAGAWATLVRELPEFLCSAYEVAGIGGVVRGGGHWWDFSAQGIAGVGSCGAARSREAPAQ